MNTFSIAIHGGAGTLVKGMMTTELESRYKEALKIALEKGYAVLDKGGTAIDAVEEAVKLLEDSPLFNAGKGSVFTANETHEMDASIMDGKTLNAGAVSLISGIKNPVGLARDVMEKTPHVMLAGKGAEEFGVSEGYEKINLLTEASKNEWKKWLENEEYKPLINIENHDTIGMLCLDKDNNMSGACTTSGLAYKMKGRVGDSPIIGSGLFIDNKIGGAVATGLGEEVVKTVGSFLVVELMRQGMSPQEACENAVNRIVSSNSQKNKFQVAYIAMNKNGEVGSFSIEPGFTYMDYINGKNEEIKTGSAL